MAAALIEPGGPVAYSIEDQEPPARKGAKAQRIGEQRGTDGCRGLGIA